MATRWGICGTGLVANDFVTVLKSLPASEHQVVAVTAKTDQTKADNFAQKYGISAAYGTYERLATDPNVEVVYVATVHPFHHKVCLMYLDHGKHVLCEKPMTMTLKEAEEVIAKAKEKKLFFLEGMWTRFYPAYKAVVEELHSGSLGKVLCVQATMIMSTREVFEPLQRTATGGGLMAIACYPVAFVQQAFKERPEKVLAVGQFTEEGGDLGGSITLQYKGGGVGQVYFHVDGAMGDSTATFYGTQGNLHVHDNMYTPTKVTYPASREKREETFPLPPMKEKFNWWNGNGFVYEAQAVRKCLQEGLTESQEMTHEDSLTIMYILEQACKQLGLEYQPPQD